MKDKKKILKYIFIIILIKVVGFGLFFLYSIEKTIEKKEYKHLKINEMKVITAPQHHKLTKEELQIQKNHLMEWKLRKKMKDIYGITINEFDAKKSKNKNLNLIREKLAEFTHIDMFIAGYNEEIYYGSNKYQDMDARTIVLEEIQKVRRRGEGFIVSRISEQGLMRYTLVKDLNFLKLYIGINIIE